MPDGDGKESSVESESDSDQTGDTDIDEEDSSSEPSIGYSAEEISYILDNTETEVLRTTLQETRPTLDTLEDFLGDIDDKAGRTLRLNTILIGLLLTALSLAFSQNLPGAAEFLNLAFYLGLVTSGISITTALLTFTRSSIRPGLATEDITEILKQDMNEKVLLLSLVLSHEEWIRENGRVNERDARSLFASHLFLFLSMGYYAFAVGWVFMQPAPQWMLWLGVVLLFPFLSLVIYLPQTIVWPLLIPIWDLWVGIVNKIRR